MHTNMAHKKRCEISTELAKMREKTSRIGEKSCRTLISAVFFLLALRDIESLGESERSSSRMRVLSLKAQSSRAHKCEIDYVDELANQREQQNVHCKLFSHVHTYNKRNVLVERVHSDRHFHVSLRVGCVGIISLRASLNAERNLVEAIKFICSIGKPCERRRERNAHLFGAGAVCTCSRVRALHK